MACNQAPGNYGKPQNLTDSLSYVLGADVAQSLEGVDLNPAFIYQGYKDVIDSSDLAIKKEDMMILGQTLQRKMMEARQEAIAREGSIQLEKGQAYLEENRNKEGFQETASGLQYRIIKAGSGMPPTADNVVKVHYEGRLIDGTVFDSSYERGTPAEFPVNQVIEGWTEALTMMKPGAKWELVIPSELAYGPSPDPRSSIPPNAVLIFDVELLEIMGQASE